MSPEFQQEEPENVRDWQAIRRQQITQAMQTINNSLIAMHVTLATGVANNDFPEEFRNHVKQQLLQIAATVEVPQQ